MHYNLKKRIKNSIGKKKSKVKTVTDLRTLIAIMRSNIKCKSVTVLRNIYYNDLSWQARISWILEANEYKGKKNCYDYYMLIWKDEEKAKELAYKAGSNFRDNNPSKNHGGKYSPYSLNFIKYEGLPLEEKLERIAALKVKMGKTQKNGASVRTVQYWLNLGYEEEEAKERLSESQKFFSKEICIRKYGVEEGTRIWKDRQYRWQSTLNNKSPEEKAEINRKRQFKGCRRSKNELHLISVLRSTGIDVDNNFRIRHSDEKWYIYDIKYKNKLIEYNGDFWHANPIKFEETQMIKYPGRGPVSAKEVWNRDAHKIEVAEQNGYSVLTVWESDFKADSNRVIDECIRFLSQ